MCAYQPALLDAAKSLRRQEESLIPDMLKSDRLMGIVNSAGKKKEKTS